MNHIIQIITLTENSEKITLKKVGNLFVKDRDMIVFNPSIKGFKKGHWTWPKDGNLHLKDDKGSVISTAKRLPLNKFKGSSQFLFSGFSKESGIHIDYKHIENSTIILLDLRNYEKGVGLSIHVTDYENINKTMNIFKEKRNHQSFVYWKSVPKIVVIAFDN